MGSCVQKIKFTRLNRGEGSSEHLYSTTFEERKGGIYKKRKADIFGN